MIEHVKKSIEQHNTLRNKKEPIPDVTSSLRSELGAPLPLHISLSRTLQIQTEDREVFLETVKTSLRKAAVRVFNIEFLGLKWVPNFDRNRWFLVLNIKKPEHDELNRLLIACNEAAKKRSHGALYTGGEGDGPMVNDCSESNRKRRKSQHDGGEEVDYSGFFHISIAWNLAEPDPEMISLVENMSIEPHIQSPEVTFDAVKVRIGNVVHKIDLAAQRGVVA